MYNLLKVLQTVIQLYSHLPMRQLFQNYLQINIFVISNPQIAKQYLKKQLNFNDKAKLQIFFKAQNTLFSANQQLRIKNQYSNGKSIFSNSKYHFIYLALNHSKILPFSSYFNIKKSQKSQKPQTKQKYQTKLQGIQNLICVTTEDKIIDNIICLNQNFYRQKFNSKIKGFFLSIPNLERGINEIINQVALYLSICELFHSHIGLALSIHQPNDLYTLTKLIKISEQKFQQDEDELLTNANYCRIFQALPYKISYKQIAEIGEIQQNVWGQKIDIHQGNDGILFWFLINHLPVLFIQQTNNSQENTKYTQSHFKKIKILPHQKQLLQKSGLKICEQANGHILLKHKSVLKQPLDSLRLSIVIINAKKQQYLMNLSSSIFDSIFQAQINKHKHSKVIEKDYKVCDKFYSQIQRLSQLLVKINDNQEYASYSNSSQHQSYEQNQAQNLSYKINRWLFMKKF